jgi:predicted DNA-binding transcriptional regulator YafY
MAKIQGSRIQRETERVTGGFDSRFERMIAIIRLLSLRWHTNPQLAKIFQVSIRTIERDIDLLYRSGFKLLYHGRGWGYSLDAGYKIPLREPEPDSE